MLTTEEMQAKITKYREMIEACRAEIALWPNRADIAAENLREIADYSERIERLEKRIAGVEPNIAPTDHAIKIIAWVNSKAYDEE
jgi:phage shock protein A